MEIDTPGVEKDETQVIVVRFWASAREAAGASSDEVPVPGPGSLTDRVRRVVARHGDRERLPRVLGVCSVLVGDRPVSAEDPDGVVVPPGSAVEFLPPFAGG